MKVRNLLIERRENYATEYPNQIVGLVQIEGEHGKMEVKLTNGAIAEIFALIKKDVQKVANYNASQAGDAITEAGAEMNLLELDK